MLEPFIQTLPDPELEIIERQLRDMGDEAHELREEYKNALRLADEKERMEKIQQIKKDIETMTSTI